MVVFRCILSGLFALGGGYFFINGKLDECMLLCFVAAVIFPYKASNWVCNGISLLLFILGLVSFNSGDIYRTILGLAAAIIMYIKFCRFSKEEKEFRREMARFERSARNFSSGYSSGSGGSYSTNTSSSGNTYDYDADMHRIYEEQRKADYERSREEERRRRQEEYDAECRRQETERLSQQRYGCGSDLSQNWDNDIRNRLK